MSEPSHDYELLEGERVDAGIRRIADGRAAKALENLEGAEGEQLAKGVHEARKSLKKLRSVLRLVREPLGEEVYRLENDRFGDAGRLLSDLRDAEAVMETVEALRERYEDELDPSALEPLVEALAAGRGSPREQSADRPSEVDRAIEMIAVGREQIPGWPLEGDDFELVRGGLRQAYERGRDAMGAVERDATAEAVHEWRKRVKDLWYMSAVIARAWPAVIGAIDDQAHELSALLGEHHDLAVLAARVRADPGLLGGGLPQPTMLDLIERRQDELIGRALPLGHRLYTEKPKRFIARIGAYWEAGPAAG